MREVLSPSQLVDLAAISTICAEFDTELVIIGATSLLLLLGDIGRFTRDVDLTVALDLDAFAHFAARLDKAGWTRQPALEHRWIAPNQSIVDLLPAGPELRRQGSILWPVSQFSMSLAGFDHVFTRAVTVPLANDLVIRVAPPQVAVLLKMIAYLEDPHRRAKDLQDIAVALRRYEANSARLFSDAVFDANLPDFGLANSFLLGVDLKELASAEDALHIHRFIAHFLDGSEEDSDEAFREWLRALDRGFSEPFIAISGY